MKMAEIVWENIRIPKDGPQWNLLRAKIPGGWLVTGTQGLTFVPDPKHEWK
jgi:hypothetical protein